MTRTTMAAPTLTRTRPPKPQAPTVMFVHGVFDDATVWDDVVAALGDRVRSA
jgi:pimeloyl-ACP methyl ester carboxylesterase